MGCILKDASSQQNSCHQMVTEEQKTDTTDVYFKPLYWKRLS